MTTVTCPACSKPGTTTIVIPVGTRVRCPSCHHRFLYSLPTLPGTQKRAPVATPPTPLPRAVATPPTPLPRATTPSVPNRPCPFCAEPILLAAQKCRHCGEFLNQPRRVVATPAPAPAPTPAPMPTIVINNSNTNVVGGTYRRWNRGLAAALSLLCPGLGQIYKGQIINGSAWFLVTVLGYCTFIVPGLILHLCCIVGASMGDPYRCR